jgi:hypothetical protein
MEILNTHLKEFNGKQAGYFILSTDNQIVDYWNEPVKGLIMYPLAIRKTGKFWTLDHLSSGSFLFQRFRNKNEAIQTANKILESFTIQELEKSADDMIADKELMSKLATIIRDNRYYVME